MVLRGFPLELAAALSAALLVASTVAEPQALASQGFSLNEFG
jgi:hypothetical protein